MSARILIAEDEPSILVSIDFLMRRSGFETRLAADGAAAIEEVRRFLPHLVILDIMLPGRSGLDVCRDIRSREDWRDMRVLMLTARGGPAEITRGLEAGADDYVVKPFSTQDLVARVRSLLEANPE